jgi:hypothetical protein
LLDRFDDRGVGALEFQGCDPKSCDPKGCDPKGCKSDPAAKRPTIGLRRKFLVKMPDCVETPLMAAFQAARRDRRHPPANRLIRAQVPFDYCGIATRSRCPMPSIPPCVIRAVDGIFRPEAAGRGRGFPRHLGIEASGKTCQVGRNSARRDNASRQWLMGEI